jgi:hypothetical protein
MPELAPPLRAFAHELAALTAALPDPMRPWLLPLSRIVGPMRVPQSHDTGDPDGFGGLARRGNYDRLLVSEWLFAIEEPDEFLRRAAMHEHMFMLPQFRDPGGATTSVALLDTGPLQLGAPRLAQLALLLVLARRAEAAGAVFRFGVLQDGDATLRELDVGAIRSWQAARSWSAASVHVDAWHERLDEIGPRDRWIIGADTQDAGAARAIATRLDANALAIAELETPTQHALVIRTHRRDAVGELATLVLPPADVAVRMLRSPFAAKSVPAARPVHAGSSRALGRLSSDGRRLVLPRDDGSIDAIHIPGSINEGQGFAKQVPRLAAYTPVTADVFARRLIAVYVRDGALVLAGCGLQAKIGRAQTSASAACSLGHHVHTGIDVPASLLPDEHGARTQLHVTHATPTEFRAWLVAEDGALFELVVRLADDLALGERTLTLVEPASRDFTRLGLTAAAWVSSTEQRIVTAPAMTVPMLPQGDTCLFAMTTQGELTVAIPRGNVVHVQHDRPVAITRPEGELFGLLWRLDSNAKELAHVLYLGPDRQDVRWRWQSGDEVVFSAPGPIDTLRYEAAAHKLVYRTRAGHRGVYSFDRRAVVWQGLPGSTGSR